MAEPLPLSGFRVLEVGQALAGPFAGTLLGYFGAEVIKIEPPSVGDPIRSWRTLDDDGTSVWWRSLARNKQSVTLDLRTARGQALCRDLALRCDVLIENFRPGTMERWGLGPEVFESLHPALVYVRVSGFGQTGPYASRPGFAAVCEAMGGMRYVTGHPGEPPVRANLSLGDTLGGLHAALGAVLSLLGRERDGARRGQVVDVALTEAVMSVMEAALPEYERHGVVRQPAGTTITGLVPSGTYRCGDGSHVVIGANSDALFRRLMGAMGREDLARDPDLAHNPGRVRAVARIDGAIAAYCAERDADAVVAELLEAEVPVGPIYDVARVVADPQVVARGWLEAVPRDGGDGYRLPQLAPRLSRTPGATHHVGPDLGVHTRAVLARELGLAEADLDALARDGVI